MVTTTLEPIYADDLDEMEEFPLRDGLPWRARREADEMLTFARGTMGIFGDRGSGKDLFGYSRAWLFKYFFNRPILIDSPPRRAFGQYTLFNPQECINQMAKSAGVEGIEKSKDRGEYEQFIDENIRQWALENEGSELLKGSVLYLTELKRYCYKRNPHNQFNKFIGSLNSIVRHWDGLIMGTHVKENEIDNYTFLQYCNIRAYCEWCMPSVRPHTTKVRVVRSGFIGSSFSMGDVAGRPLTIYVNGMEPRDFLDGKNFFSIWKSKSKVNLRPVLRKEMR